MKKPLQKAEFETSRKDNEVENAFLFEKETKLPKTEIPEAIENTRLEYMSQYKKNRFYGRLVFGIVVGLIIAGFAVQMILAGNNLAPDWLIYLLLGLFVLILVAAFVLSHFSKKWLKNKQNDYVSNVMNYYGDYLYGTDGYEGYSLDLKETFTKEHFDISAIYSNVLKANSRGVYTVRYKNFTYKVAEAVADVASSRPKKLLGKQPSVTAFLGRFFISTHNLNIKHPLYIYVKGKADVISYPSEVEKLRLIDATEKYDLLGDGNDRKEIKKKVLDLCRSFKIDEILYDLTFAFHPGGKAFVTVSYSNDTISFPLETVYDNKYLHREYCDELIVREILEIVNE